jgi:hypothetical protein
MAGTVLVGCNYPNGLVLRLFDYITAYQDVINGGKREVQVPVARNGSEVRLRGPAVRPGIVPKYKIIQSRAREGYAITRVDADWFEEWLEQNKNTDIVKNKVVIYHEKDTPGMAKEMQNVRNNLEPLNPEMIHSEGKLKHSDLRISNRITTNPKDDEGMPEV